ncbi:CPCC family cysteine-rich protein [Dickeya zeae]|nr:CPCC family cysteine-rich protein [Dickeya zeae]
MKENKLYPCLCCGNRTIGDTGNYEICSVCGWEDDPVQSRDPDFSGGANPSSLNRSKQVWVTDKLNK